jgi:hypothetical protein
VLATDAIGDPSTLATTYLEAIKAAAQKAEECLRKAKDATKQKWD